MAWQDSHASPESGGLKFACKSTLSFLFSLGRRRRRRRRRVSHMSVLPVRRPNSKVPASMMQHVQ